jgi:hypothetical protein
MFDVRCPIKNTRDAQLLCSCDQLPPVNFYGIHPVDGLAFDRLEIDARHVAKIQLPIFPVDKA